jgi:hypothetical protein
VEVGKAPESEAEKKAAGLKLLPKAQRVVKVNVSWKNLTATATAGADGAAAGNASSPSSFSLFHNNGARTHSNHHLPFRSHARYPVDGDVDDGGGGGGGAVFANLLAEPSADAANGGQVRAHFTQHRDDRQLGPRCLGLDVQSCVPFFCLNQRDRLCRRLCSCQPPRRRS